jgi:hypothetical protein
MTKFPARQEMKKLQIFEIPNDFWIVPKDSKSSRAIQNALESAVIYGQQLTKRRNVRRYEAEFSLMCEVVEREAAQNHKLITEVDGDESLAILDALKHREKELKDISFSFVVPKEMHQFRKRLNSEKLTSMFQNVQGGIAILPKPWEYAFIAPKIINTTNRAILHFPPDLQKAIEDKIEIKKANRRYASNLKEIDRAHGILRKSLREDLPFSTASIMGRVRANVFIEMVTDYIYQMRNTMPIMMSISYGDGTGGSRFPLFFLKRIAMPDKSKFFNLKVGLVSLRHNADKHIDRSLVRNREIQMKANARDQEELAFKRTYECLDEVLRYIRGEIRNEKDLSLSLAVLIGCRPELKTVTFGGLDLEVFHTTGLESAGIGTYLAVLDILNKYRGQLIVTPRIIVPSGEFKRGEEIF